MCVCVCVCVFVCVVLFVYSSLFDAYYACSAVIWRGRGLLLSGREEELLSGEGGVIWDLFVLNDTMRDLRDAYHACSVVCQYYCRTYYNALRLGGV